MLKIEIKAVSRPHRSSERMLHFVELKVDGVIFTTECTGPDTARDLVIKTARALGITSLTSINDMLKDS